MMTEITIADCVTMHDLLKYHKSWNNGLDWVWGSPNKGQLRYVIPDHDVILTRTHMHSYSLHVDGVTHTFNLWFVHMCYEHPDLLLEAQWCDNYTPEIWDELVQKGTINPVLMSAQWCHYVGDPWVFLNCLTEFKLWNSLTDNPEII